MDLGLLLVISTPHLRHAFDTLEQLRQTEMRP
jgi:hypothetical protein